MAHDLTRRANGKVEMAYVGELPWHKLGQSVTKGASIGVWRREAGLDWEAKTAVAQFHNEDGLLLPYDKFKTVYRSDTCAPIGMVSHKYEVVQPAEVLEFFRDLTESGGWHIHTAGSLRGGSKIWAMASADGLTGNVGKFDPVHGNLLLATSMDGSMKTTAKLTSVRVVCANTLALALNKMSDPTITISHRSVFNADEIKQSLGVAVPAFQAFMLQANAMAEVGINVSEAREVLRGLFGQPTESDIKETSSDFEFHQLMAQFAKPGVKMREQRSVDRVLALFGGEGRGVGLSSAKGTRWGLLQACTQHIDHERGRTDDTRMDSAWFGNGDETKRRALQMLEVTT